MVIFNDVEIVNLGEDKGVFFYSNSLLDSIHEIILNNKFLTSVAYFFIWILYLLIGELARSAGTHTTW